jgi:ABC-type multidrug transport system fused ATPase/permease subunit
MARASRATEEEDASAPSEEISAPSRFSWNNLGPRLRRFLRTARFPLSLVVLAVGVALTVIAMGAWTPLISDPPFNSLAPPLLGPDCSERPAPPCSSTPPTTGVDWTLAFWIVGPILALVGVYMSYAYLKARWRFEHLMRTKSKAEFLRSVAEVEDLLWDLTPKDEVRLLQKKQELKIRS